MELQIPNHDRIYFGIYNKWRFAGLGEPLAIIHYKNGFSIKYKPCILGYPHLWKPPHEYNYPPKKERCTFHRHFLGAMLPSAGTICSRKVVAIEKKQESSKQHTQKCDSAPSESNVIDFGPCFEFDVLFVGIIKVLI